MRLSIIFSVTLLVVSFGFGFTKADTAEGWASLNGGTTGGIGGEEVTVSTSEELKEAAESTGKKIILVKKGDYSGEIKPQSNKSILGLEPGVVLDGTLRIETVQNVIVRNIAVINSKKCGSYQQCKRGSDAIYVGLGAQNVWLDHLDVSDGQDGNCDVTWEADFVSITWCKFWYSYDKAHAFSNLIASSNNETASRGKLNITYAYCWWADRVQERQPWGRFGKIHIFNNLYTSQRARYACASGVEMQMLLENNVFNNSGHGYLKDGGAWKCVGNIGTAKQITGGEGEVFTPPYALSIRMEASEVEAKLRSEAGNTMAFTKTVSRKRAGRSAATRPTVNNTESGWMLHNPTPSKLLFTVVAPDGRLVLPATGVEAGGNVQLPSSASLLYINFKGTNAPTDGALPLLP